MKSGMVVARHRSRLVPVCAMLSKTTNPLPGFRLALGFTVAYLGLLILVPVAGLCVKVFHLSWAEFWRLVWNERALAAYKLSLGASLASSVANAVFGSLLAWVLVRYRFPGRKWIDGFIDFPFALPTAVAGLTLANLFSQNGWLGKFLVPLGIEGAFTQLGVVIAMTFVGMPFAVRTLQPVLEDFDKNLEEAAATLGAGRLQTVLRVIAPSLLPGILTGFSLSFARALGEYGSVVFISGNLPFRTEVAPYLIVMRLEEYNYSGAMAIAMVLMIFSFILLAVTNTLEAWSKRFQRA